MTLRRRVRRREYMELGKAALRDRFPVHGEKRACGRDGNGNAGWRQDSTTSGKRQVRLV
jgi:hypothetical protein